MTLDKMQTGYVFPIHAGSSFGVLTYFPETEVYVALLPGVLTVKDACKALSRERSGIFLPADRDTKLWGEAVFKARGAAMML